MALVVQVIADGDVQEHLRVREQQARGIRVYAPAVKVEEELVGRRVAVDEVQGFSDVQMEEQVNAAVGCVAVPLG
jgi:hypothetical protein